MIELDCHHSSVYVIPNDGLKLDIKIQIISRTIANSKSTVNGGQEKRGMQKSQAERQEYAYIIRNAFPADVV